jgi:hypothetical protein
MNILCPACGKRVAVPDEAAGRPTPCPLCGEAFTPPALTPAAIDAAPPVPKPAPPPPSPPPPAPPPFTPPPAAVTSPSEPSRAGGQCCTLTLSRRWVRWLAPVALIAAFVLSFFPWVGSYPNGSPVYTQSAWKAMRGAVGVADPAGEYVMKKHEALEKNSNVNGCLVLYCLLLIPAALLSAGVIATSLVDFTMPDAVQRVWGQRDLALAALGLILPALLAVPLLFGFGLEKAAALAAEAAVPPVAAPAEGAKPDALESQKRDLRRDVEFASYAVDRTWWLRLALLAQGVALFGTAATVWLNRRGDRPEPRVEFYS